MVDESRQTEKRNESYTKDALCSTDRQRFVNILSPLVGGGITPACFLCILTKFGIVVRGGVSRNHAVVFSNIAT